MVTSSDDDRVNIGQSASGRWNGRILQNPISATIWQVVEMIQDEKSNNLHWVKFKIWYKLISINNNKSETSSWDDSGWEEQQLALGGSEGRRPSARCHKGDTSVSPKDNLLSFKQFIFHPSKDDLLYLSKDRPWKKRRSSLCCKSQGCWRPLGRRWVSPISSFHFWLKLIFKGNSIRRWGLLICRMEARWI